jgi:thiol-disulfide isomerase/thioredoxin
MPDVSFVLGFVLGAVAGPLLIVAALSWHVRRRLKKQGYQPPWVPAGDVVPLDWEVQTLDGKVVSLGEHFAGRVAFLNFWATWCPPCVGEAASIDRLYERFKGRVAFACLSQETPGTIERFQGKTGHQFTMFHLGSNPPREFQTEGIPATFIISKSRRAVLRHVGAADWAHESVVRFLENLLDDGGEGRGTSGPGSNVSSAGERSPPSGVGGGDTDQPKVCGLTNRCN